MECCQFNSCTIRNVPIIQYLATLSGTLSIICCGMHYGWPSPSLPILFNSTLHITGDEGSWIAVMPVVGAAFGAISGIFIHNAMGRKMVILLTLFPYFIAWIIIAFAKSVLMFIVARFISGTSDGLLFAALPMYLGEVADSHIRGMLSCSISVGWIFGTLLVNIIGSYLTIRNTALVSSIVPVVCLITFCWMPESPYYLIMNGNHEAARRSLRIFKRTKDVEFELQRITNGIKEQNENGGSRCDLFTIRSNRKAFLITLVLRAVQQLTGTAAITFYAQTIFHQVEDIIAPSTTTIMYFTIQVIFCGCSSVIVDKAGRKPLLIISIIGTALALFTEGIYLYVSTLPDINTSSFSWIPIIALIGYVIMYSIGMQTIPLLLLGELFPVNIKGFTLSIVNVSVCVVITVVSKYFQITKDIYGLHVPFFSFTVCSILGLFFIILCVPETKGKTLEEIQLALKGGERSVVV